MGGGVAWDAEKVRQPLSCKACQESWDFPRRIEYRLTSDVPSNIPPSTPKAVIAYQTASQNKATIPEELFQQLQYTATIKPYMKHRLLREFEYHATSGEFYPNINSQEDGDVKYARLITLNSWYTQLFLSMLFMCTSAIDLEANFLLCVSLLSRGGEQVEEHVRYAFCILWVLLTLLTLILARDEAKWEWTIKSSAMVGDLIDETHWWDGTCAFSALVMFKFFLVDMTIKDIVILLHPWKSVQPFAAFKMENARAYVVGYPFEAQFRVENKAGQDWGLPIQMVTKVMLLAFKVYLAYLKFTSGGSDWISVLASCISTAGSCFWLILKMYFVIKDRRECKRRLIKQLLGLKKTDERQRHAILKLLAMHYHITVDVDNKTSKLSRTEYMEKIARPPKSTATWCTKCGRDSLKVTNGECNDHKVSRIDGSVEFGGTPPVLRSKSKDQVVTINVAEGAILPIAREPDGCVDCRCTTEPCQELQPQVLMPGAVGSFAVEEAPPASDG